MLTKELLRVSRAGGGYHPQFATREHRPLAARVIGTYQGHVGETRGDLESALTNLEREADDFKLVRGFAALLDRDATFETDAAIDPERARRVAFEAAETIGVVSTAEREQALDRAGESVGLSADAIDRSLYADLDERQRLAAVDSRWDPDALLAQYTLSLAQTALFDATELRVRSSDPKSLVTAIKRLGLMYEIRRPEPASATADGDRLSEREVVVTGPTHLFRSTRRYGTRFGRLLRTIAKHDEWRVVVTIDDRGTERTLTLSHADPVRVPDAEPIADVSFDSSVEADFAGRIASLDLDWDLVREPEPLATGTRVMIPDFAFDYQYDEFRVYLEIMGFWTPEYVEKKLGQLSGLEDVELLVAVDESLGVGEEIAARDFRAIPYTGTVRIKDVVDVLGEYERQLVADSAAELPEELRPESDVVTIDSIASEYGVSEAALADVAFPDHDRVGRTLLRPATLEAIGTEIDAGISLSDAEAILDDHGVAETSAVLSRLGYRVAWEGLSGGTIERRADSTDDQ